MGKTQTPLPAPGRKFSGSPAKMSREVASLVSCSDASVKPGRYRRKM